MYMYKSRYLVWSHTPCATLISIFSSIPTPQGRWFHCMVMGSSKVARPTMQLILYLGKVKLGDNLNYGCSLPKSTESLKTRQFDKHCLSQTVHRTHISEYVSKYINIRTCTVITSCDYVLS